MDQEKSRYSMVIREVEYRIASKNISPHFLVLHGNSYHHLPRSMAPHLSHSSPPIIRNPRNSILPNPSRESVALGISVLPGSGRAVDFFRWPTILRTVERLSSNHRMHPLIQSITTIIQNGRQARVAKRLAGEWGMGFHDVAPRRLCSWRQ